MIKRIGTAILASWGYALAYSAIAVVLYGISPRQGLPKTSLREVVAIYWIGATIIGVVVGLLRPFANSGLTRAAIGFVAAWPAVLGGYVVINDTWFSTLGRGDYIAVTLLALVYGAIGSTFFRPEASPR